MFCVVIVIANRIISQEFLSKPDDLPKQEFTLNLKYVRMVRTDGHPPYLRTHFPLSCQNN